MIEKIYYYVIDLAKISAFSILSIYSLDKYKKESINNVHLLFY